MRARWCARSNQCVTVLAMDDSGVAIVSSQAAVQTVMAHDFDWSDVQYQEADEVTVENAPCLLRLRWSYPATCVLLPQMTQVVALSARDGNLGLADDTADAMVAQSCLGAMTQLTALDLGFESPTRVVTLVEHGTLGRLVQLVSLRLNCSYFHERVAKVLATPKGLGALSSLTRLDLYGNTIGGEGVVALATGHGLGALAQLTHLCLRDCRIGADGADALASPCGLMALPQLTILDLSRNELGAAGIKALAAEHGFGAVTRLTRLYLSKNDMDVDAACSLATRWGLPVLRRLDTLDLGLNHLGATRPELPNLRSLAKMGMRPYAGDRFLASGRDAMMQMPRWLASLTHLTTLSLSGNFIGSAAMEAMLRHRGLRALSRLEDLNLGNNRIDHRCAVELASLHGFGALTRLKHLCLGKNMLGDSGIAALVSPEGLRLLVCLETLDVSSNGISDNGVAVLASRQGLGALPRLTTLNLSGNYFGDAGATALATTDGLGALSSLTALTLRETDIEDDGVAALATEHGLGALPNLTTLDLSVNSITTKGVLTLATVRHGLRSLTQLTSLDLNGREEICSDASFRVINCLPRDRPLVFFGIGSLLLVPAPYSRFARQMRYVRTTLCPVSEHESFARGCCSVGVVRWDLPVDVRRERALANMSYPELPRELPSLLHLAANVALSNMRGGSSDLSGMLPRDLVTLLADAYECCCGACGRRRFTGPFVPCGEYHGAYSVQAWMRPECYGEFLDSRYDAGSEQWFKERYVYPVY